MFSGQIPFHDLNNYAISLAVTQGIRPRRPLHDLCRIRGLNDDIWAIMETCWAEKPSERPSASQIKDRLSFLADKSVDQRPVDTFHTSPWRRGSQPGYLFSHLTIGMIQM